MKKFLALLLAAMMLLGMTSAFAEATDTITVMVPPVTGTYLDDIDTWANDFPKSRWKSSRLPGTTITAS